VCAVLKIETRLDAIEVSGAEVKGLPNDADQLIVSAHRIYNRLVILDFHGRNVTVSANELERAIQNARNHD
jgi:hypothetical protein